MKKKIFVLFLIAIGFSIIHMSTLEYPTQVFAEENKSYNGFAGGDGSQSSPYQISNKTQLNLVRDYSDAYFILVNDIIFTDEDFKDGGEFYNKGTSFAFGHVSEDDSYYYKDYGWIPIPTFNGDFNGNDYSIKNLTLSHAIEDEPFYVGLFASNSGKIYNLFMQDCDYLGQSSNTLYIGSVSGMNEGTIENCVASGMIHGYYSYTHAGGIVGWNRSMNWYTFPNYPLKNHKEYSQENLIILQWNSKNSLHFPLLFFQVFLLCIQ